MKKFYILVKKEVRELLTPQMLLPLIGVALVFILIGKVAGSEVKKIQAPQHIGILDLDQTQASQTLESVLSKGNFIVDRIEAADEAQLLSQAKAKNDKLAIVIPQGFENGVKNSQTQSLKTYTLMKNFSLTSGSVNQVLAGAIAAINASLTKDVKVPVTTNDFVVIGDKIANISPALITNFITSQTTFIPIVLFLVIVLSSQLIAVSIATEKENKTLETLLSAPVSRNAIVAAKLVGAGLVALGSSVVYLFGMNYYLSGLTGGGLATGTSDATRAAATQLGLIFNAGDYVLLGLSLFFGILAALSIAIILGSFAEDAKSAQGVVTPLMLLILIPYFLVMFLDVTSLSPALRYLIYAIPFSHPFMAGPNIMLRQYQSVIYGILYMAAFFMFFVYLAAKIFASDKILTMRLNFKKKNIFKQ